MKNQKVKYLEELAEICESVAVNHPASIWRESNIDTEIDWAPGSLYRQGELEISTIHPTHDTTILKVYEKEILVYDTILSYEEGRAYPVLQLYHKGDWEHKVKELYKETFKEINRL